MNKLIARKSSAVLALLLLLAPGVRAFADPVVTGCDPEPQVVTGCDPEPQFSIVSLALLIIHLA